MPAASLQRRTRATLDLARAVVLALIAATLTIGLAGASSAADGKGDGGAVSKPTLRELATPGTISGTASVEGGGTFDGNVTLYRWDSEGQYFDYWDDAYVESDYPDYSFDVTSGDFYLELRVYGTLYQRGYSDGAEAPPTSLSDPGVVHITAGGGAEEDLEALLDPDVHAVTGTVVDSSSDPIPYVEIDAEIDLGDGDSSYVGSAYTDENGEFTIYLAPGDYLFYVYADSDFDSISLSVTVPDADLELDPITLATVGRWTVSGTISDAEGALAGGTVELYRLWGSPGEWDDYDWEDEAEVGSDGTYSFEGVRGGASRYYTVRASAPGHARTFYGDTPSLWDAEGFTLEADRTGVDIELDLASSISGVVSGPDGPATDVGVLLYRWYEDEDEPAGGYFENVDEYYTEEDGAFAFDTLSPGSYAVYYDASYSSPPLQSAWLGGAAAPSSPTDPGIITVAETPQDHDASTTLVRARIATGTVTDQSDEPVENASVTTYVWDDGWSQFATARTDEDGTFAARVPENSVVTFRAARGGYDPIFYGGGSTLPATPTGGNSVTTTTSDLTVGTLVLPPFVSKLGKVAGQKLDYCLTHVLPANDDSSTSAVDIPFDLTYFGTPYDDLYVNNNGNVTFGDSESQFTPSSLTGATSLPIIAPFFADVDTGGEGSNVVTYGASPDGRTLCVNWADVGFYSERTDKLNTFQLLLTKNTSGAGRGPGDFDITFNYDEILWETGEASRGVDGLGGTSAAAGFSAGSGLEGTYVQLPGSFVNGALLDSGANSLVGHSQGSSQLGRYVFQVRNSGLTSSLGSLKGSVLKAADSTPIEGAYVQACRTTGTGCSYAYTDETGAYSFTALLAAAYAIRVWPPTDALFGGGTTATVVGGESTTAPTVRLSAPTPPPPGVTLTNNGTSANGVPSVNYAQSLAFAMTGCPGVSSPTYSVTLADGRVIRDHLPLTESPAGHYTASIAPLTPYTGDATISTTVPVSCGQAPVAFNVYIDPSGVVADQWGRPIAGAEATLLRSDTEGGSYTMVPDGSDLMSESNRANPTVTDATGYFRWDVQSGWYKVTAAATGCASTTTSAMEVPPERIDLLIKLACDADEPAPTAAPTISGVAKVGKALTPVSATWAGPLVEDSLELLRNGVPVSLTAGHYVLTTDDVGASFVARSTGQRPDYVQENGSGETVTFSAVTATSSAVTGAAADPTPTPTPTTDPTPTPKRTATVKLKVGKKVKAATKVKVKVTVSATGTAPTGKVVLKDGKKKKRKLTAGKLAGGKVTLTVKLKPGKHQLSASYGGDSTTAPASSAVVAVKAIKKKSKKKKK